MKEVLVVYYSQTGQLHDIISKITSGLNDDNINITSQQRNQHTHLHRSASVTLKLYMGVQV